MKPKPKISKATGEWRVERPGYGFTGPTILGPFPTQAAALAALQISTGSAPSQAAAATAPVAPRWRGHQIWPLVIR
jgi:hypothetical protein